MTCKKTVCRQGPNRTIHEITERKQNFFSIEITIIKIFFYDNCVFGLRQFKAFCYFEHFPSSCYLQMKNLKK